MQILRQNKWDTTISLGFAKIEKQVDKLWLNLIKMRYGLKNGFN